MINGPAEPTGATELTRICLNYDLATRKSCKAENVIDLTDKTPGTTIFPQCSECGKPMRVTIPWKVTE